MRVTASVVIPMLTLALGASAIAAPPVCPGLPEPIVEARVITWQQGPGDVRSVRLQRGQALTPVVASVTREGRAYAELYSLDDGDRPMLSLAESFLVESSFGGETLAMMVTEPDGGGLSRLVVHVVANTAENPEVLATVELATALPFGAIASAGAGQLISEPGYTDTSAIGSEPASPGGIPLLRNVLAHAGQHLLPAVPSPVDVATSRLLGFDGGWLVLWDELGTVRCRVISRNGIAGEPVQIGAGSLIGTSRIGELTIAVLSRRDGEPALALVAPGPIPVATSVDARAARTPVTDLSLSATGREEPTLVSLAALMTQRGRITLKEDDWRVDVPLGPNGRIRVQQPSSQRPPMSIGLGDLHVLDGWTDAGGIHILAWHPFGSSAGNGGSLISISLGQAGAPGTPGRPLHQLVAPIDPQSQRGERPRPPFEPIVWDALTSRAIRPPFEPIEWEALQPLLPTPLPTDLEWTLGVRTIVPSTGAAVDIGSLRLGPNEPLEPIEFRSVLPGLPLVIELRHLASIPAARSIELD